MKIVLSGNPLSTSHIYLYHCRRGYPCGYMSAMGKKAKEQYQSEMWKQRVGKVLTEPFKVDITIYFGNKAKHDADNFSKLILDSGNKILWEDDGLIEEMTVRKKYDREKPRIELEVY